MVLRDHRRIIVALDFANAEEALQLLEQLSPAQCRVKIGKELFTRAGPDLVQKVIALGFDVFLDLKFHDIPSTVAKAVRAAADLGVWMVNVHASGGQAMMHAARDAVDSCSQRPLLIAVTVLTSMQQEDLAAIGVDRSPLEHVLRLAALASGSGMDGVVCSAEETAELRRLLREDFILVTPGIRPEGDAAQDQKRVVTPSEALLAGSSYLVIGRPITQARRPGERLQQIQQQITGALPEIN
jgi:orotidine-5'-phosphate decarboxylase